MSKRSFSPAGIFKPIGPRNFSGVKSKPLKIGFDVRRQLADAVIEAGNSDRAVRPMQADKDIREHVDRIARRTAE